MSLARWALRCVAILLAAIVVSALLAASSPGVGVEDRELDPRLSSESVQKLRADHARDQSPFLMVRTVLKDAVHGELGTSSLYHVKISRLLQTRAVLSAQYLAGGLLIAWFFAAALVFLEQLIAPRLSLFPRMAATALLMVPSAALAAALGLWTDAAPFFCMAAVVFAKVYAVFSEIARKSAAARHSFYALANGMGLRQRLFFSVLPEAAPELLALLGLSVNIAIGTLIAVEAVCDKPGLGRLAIEAAMNRDTRVVIVLTVIICAMTQLANSHRRFWIKRRQWL
ncbi:MAG: ABC transporter permease subunit [Acidobacteriia bacterium]|nr:ABC transporter permease subunit [Terriglobia bacterium]